MAGDLKLFFKARKQVFLKYFWNENFVLIPSIFLQNMLMLSDTRVGPIISILFWDLVRFAIELSLNGF